VGSDGRDGLNVLRPAPGAPFRAAVVSGAGVLAAVAMLLPLRLCLSAALLHIPCPGCGMTRAAFALLRGDWSAAFALHPLSIFIAPVGAVLALEHADRYVWTGQALGPPARWKAALLALFVVLLVAVWISRFFGSFGGPVPV
jgi:hypothetical protein